MRHPDSLSSGHLQLTSPEFEDGSSMPRRYTCDGDDVSPPLEWTGAPDDAASLALVMDDPDARGFVHWVVINIDPSATGGLPAGWSEDGEFQGTNSYGGIGYRGPCPPSGAHRYVFRLMALDTVLELSDAPSADEVLSVAVGHMLDEASLRATYERAR